MTNLRLSSPIFKSAITLVLLFRVMPAEALEAPTITAAPKGPNQINLTWSAVSNPGWGYKVEIQSEDDSRYAAWTELSWQSETPQSTTGGHLSYLPYWVTEGHYLDVTDGAGTASGACTSPSPACGSRAQAQIYGLMHNTAYNFRVRTCGKSDASAFQYSPYSNTESTNTKNPPAVRYVTQGGSGLQNGTSWADSWGKISDANGVAPSTLVLIQAGNYPSDVIQPSNSGTQADRTVFQAYQGGAVNISSPNGGYWAVNTNGQSYIIVDGINCTYTANTDTERYSVSGSRNAVVNFDIMGQPADNWGALNVLGDYNLVHNHYIHDSGTETTDQSSNIVIYGSYHYNIVQYGISIRGTHDCMLLKAGPSYNQIKNSRHGGNWGHGININNEGSVTTHHNLVEGMTIYDVAKTHNQNNIDFKNGIQFPSNYNTIRRNIVYGGNHPALTGNPITGNAIEINTEGSAVVGNNLIYNNTFFNNGGLGLLLWDGFTPTSQNDNVIANNIFYNNGTIWPSADPPLKQGGSFLWAGSPGRIVADIHHNYIIQNSDPNFACIQPEAYEEQTAYTVDQVQANPEYASVFHNNFGSLNPEFIDIENNDVHLKPQSDVINKGQAVIDDTWGNIGFSSSAPDLGAFEYYGTGTAAINSSLIKAPGIFCNGSRIRVSLPNGFVPSGYLELRSTAGSLVQHLPIERKQRKAEFDISRDEGRLDKGIYFMKLSGLENNEKRVLTAKVTIW